MLAQYFSPLVDKNSPYWLTQSPLLVGKISFLSLPLLAYVRTPIPQLVDTISSTCSQDFPNFFLYILVHFNQWWSSVSPIDNACFLNWPTLPLGRLAPSPPLGSHYFSIVGCYNFPHCLANNFYPRWTQFPPACCRSLTSKTSPLVNR
jgi:hypothetical protein